MKICTSEETAIKEEPEESPRTDVFPVKEEPSVKTEPVLILNVKVEDQAIST